MVDDGTLLSDSVIIQSLCKGRTRTEGYTDSKGHFSFEINSLKESGTAGNGNAAGNAQASDSAPFGLEQDRSETGFGQTRPGSDRLRDYWRDCELQAVLPGFTSQIVQMAGKLDNMGLTDVGTIVLHRLSQVQGFTISATSAGAPAKAKKEYEKGLELEKKENWDPALASFQKAVEVYPEYAIAWFEMGRVQVHKGDPGAGNRSTSPCRSIPSLSARITNWLKWRCETSNGRK
jgi:tetratricopeptide (TPR) repeat protein